MHVKHLFSHDEVGDNMVHYVRRLNSDKLREFLNLDLVAFPQVNPAKTPMSTASP